MEARKQQILRAVVKEFTTSAVPVGSQALARRYFLNLSSATIRNELADLAELGYLVQPHTSAGRIPTDRGYRYFVDFLMDVEALPRQVKTFIDDELRGAPHDPLGQVERVAMTVAAVTGNASVVTAPHGPRARVKHLDLVSLEPTEALLILLVEGNLMRQQVLRLEKPHTQAELSRLAVRLNRELGGKDRFDIGEPAPRPPSELERAVLRVLSDVLVQFERGSETLVVHDGVRNLLRQPEFAEHARLQQVLDVLEETRYLAILLRELIGDSDLQIVIGSENSSSQLRECTVVLTTYGPSDRIRGVLGAVGPTRMQYSQIVARLRAVARTASDRMAEAGA
ncbi:MAG TPA: heat-inducible transcriptional repressor HrcA [Candidatus Acidoferrales bacterium]|nr:heat-inducible transcriptional repressor HrcA [Candidatus Acidoferrales bacterium]